MDSILRLNEKHEEIKETNRGIKYGKKPPKEIDTTFPEINL